MLGFSGGRRRVVLGAVLGCGLLLGGCVPGKADGKAAGPSGAPVVAMVIGAEDAEKVFNQWVGVRKASLDRGDAAGIATVETGPLLAESLARIEVAKVRSTGGFHSFIGKPEFFVPAEAEQQAYPRSFVVMSRQATSYVMPNRHAGVQYFVQEAPGGPWKAAALSWVYDQPLVAGKNDGGMGGSLGFEGREKEIAAIARDAAGAVALSPTAAREREVCRRYAGYMSFTAPEGKPESEYFVPGKLTSEVVAAYNVAFGDLEDIRKRYAFEVTGPDLPVVRLADGKSLVTCSFVRTDLWKGKNVTFSYGTDETGDIAALIGGADKWWKETTVRRSVTVTFEVPAQGPAEVVSGNALVSNSHVVPVLSAQGTPG